MSIFVKNFFKMIQKRSPIQMGEIIFILFRFWKGIMQYIYKDMNKVFRGGPNESNHSFFETVE